MNIYNASYSLIWPMGGYQEYEYVIIANTEAEALGLALEARPDTNAKDWDIDLKDWDIDLIVS